MTSSGAWWLVITSVRVGFELGSSLYCTVWVMSWMGVAPVAQFSSGPSCGQRTPGACRSEGLVVGEHVPDRVGELARDREGGDLAAALAPVPGAAALEDGAVERVSAGGVRRLDKRPAQVVGAVLAQGPAAVCLPGLLDPGGKAAVADQLHRRSEAGDVADLGGDRVGEHPGDPGAGDKQGHV